MSGVHIFRVEGAVEAWQPFAELLASAGLRFGWLELEDVEPPADLGQAAAMGALRAVAAGSGGIVAVKSARRELVFRDLFREHFQGCNVVLVRGSLKAARLEAAGDHWVVHPQKGAAVKVDSTALLARLRAPGMRSRDI